MHFRAYVMGKFEQKTIRDSLLGMLTDHLVNGCIACAITHQVGCELVALLAAYREEDRRLYPEVYLLGPAPDDLLRVLFPGSLTLLLGTFSIGGDEVGLSRKVAGTALKACASLAIDGWAVFIRRDTDANSFQYGLFRPAAGPYSGGGEDTLANAQAPAALFRNSAENTVEIINSTGDRLELSLTTAIPSTFSLGEEIRKMSQAVCKDVQEDGREQAVGYIARVLTEALRTCHGALVGVVSPGQVRSLGGFRDGIVLPDPIPLVETVLGTIRDHTEGNVTLLRSYESLLRGMVMSDGVTMLGTDGSIQAFRVFVNPSSGPTANSPTQSSGGARSRAFEVLRACIGTSLHAALFRSQDGRTEVVVQS